MCVPKDLVNLWTDMILIYNAAFIRSLKDLYLYWGIVPPPSQEKSPLEKNDPLIFFYFFFLNLKFKVEDGWPPPSLRGL